MNSHCVIYMFEYLQQRADVRVKRCNEMIQGIKVIKLLAWEMFITKGINDARKTELKFLLKNAVFRAMFSKIYILQFNPYSAGTESDYPLPPV